MPTATAEAPAAVTPKPLEDKGLLEILGDATKEAFANKKQVGMHGEQAEPEKPAAAEPAPKAAAPDKKESAVPDPDEPAPQKEDDDTPAHLPEKAKADWKSLREARRKADDENATLKKRVSELEATQNTAELDELRKRLADYQERLTVVALEREPRFQQYFDGRTKQLLDTAKSVGGDKIAGILQMPDSEYRTRALNEAYAELDPVAQSRVGAVLNSFDELKAQRQGELARAGEAYKALQDENNSKAKAARDQHNRVMEDVLERWSSLEKGNPVLQPREGDKEWNSGVESRKQQARDIFSGKLSVQDTARAAAWAAAGPELATQLRGAKKREAELLEEISQLKAAKPGLGNGGGAGGSEEADGNLTFMEAVNKGYRR